MNEADPSEATSASAQPPHKASPALSETMEPALDRLALAAVISGITGVGIALSLSLPLLSVVLEARGIAPTLIGLNTATAGVAAIIILPFATGLASRFGTARLIVASFATMAVTLLAFYVTQPFALWFPLRFVFSAAVTLIFALTEFWINSLAPERRRGLIIGIYATFLSAGFAGGPIILALVGADGIMPFLVGSACILVAAIPVVAVRTREPHLPRQWQANLLRFVAAAPLALFAGLVFGALESGGQAILPLYGTALGLTAGQSVMLVSAIAAGNIVSQIPIGALADRVNRRHLLIASAAVGVAGAALLPLVAQNYAALLGVLFVTGGIVAGLYTIGLILLGARYTGGDLASANAAFVMMYAFGMLIGPVALGTGLDVWPPHGFPLAMGVMFGIYVILGLLRVRPRSGPTSP